MSLLDFAVHRDRALATGKKVSAEKVSTWRDDCDLLYEKIMDRQPLDAPNPAAGLAAAHNHEAESAGGAVDMGAPLAFVQNFPRGFIAGPAVIEGRAVHAPVPLLQGRFHYGHSTGSTVGGWNSYKADWEVLKAGGGGGAYFRFLRTRTAARLADGYGPAYLRLLAGFHERQFLFPATDNRAAVDDSSFAAVELALDLWDVPAVKAKLLQNQPFDLVVGIFADLPADTTLEVCDAGFGIPAWALGAR